MPFIGKPVAKDYGDFKGIADTPIKVEKQKDHP
jgi:hypothetical protein